MKRSSLVLIWLAGLIGAAQAAPTITTFAGGAAPNGTATNWGVSPYDSVTDAAGNTYVADAIVSRVLKIDAAGQISSIAGQDVAGSAGDGGPATAAYLNSPYGLAIDSSGNLYVADTGNHKVRRIAAGTGVITTVAGSGVSGFSGDGGPATSARLNSPTGVTVDAAGTLFIADSQNHRIRKVSGGIISTVVGGAPYGIGPAMAAGLNGPAGLAIDGAGTVYISVRDDSIVLRLSPAGLLSLVAGTSISGFSGDGGPGTSAQLSSPYGLALDSAGNLLIADLGNQRIRRVNTTTGVITTVAGTGTAGYNGEGVATTRYLYLPYDVAADSAGNFYIADYYNQRIRKVDAAGNISTVAGTGTAGYNGDNIPANTAMLNNVRSIAVDASSNLYIADSVNCRVRMVSAATSQITTVGGTGSCAATNASGPATTTPIWNPSAVEVDANANVYFIDINRRVSRIDAVTGLFTVVAGTTQIFCCTGYNGDGTPATDKWLDQPAALAVDASGNVYIADTNNYRVRKVTGGTISTVAGAGGCCVYGDGGAATAARLRYPARVAVDTSGNLYIADRYNNRIRRIDATTQAITTIAGTGDTPGGTGYIGDGGVATNARVYSPYGVTVDGSGAVLMADYGNSRIRRIDPSTQYISTVAGSGGYGYTGDGILATSASLNSPLSVRLDSSGALIISDTGNYRVRRVSGGIIATTAGTGQPRFGGDGGAASAAQFSAIYGTTTDAIGDVYIADMDNSRVRRVDAVTGVVTTVAGTGVLGFSGDGGSATSARLKRPFGVAVDGVGNLYISDYSDHRVRKVDAAGTISTVAGTGTPGYNGDNIPATSAMLFYPASLVVDSIGNLYISDAVNNRVRRRDAATGLITTVAGTGSAGYNGDNISAAGAMLNSPYGIALDSSGNLFIADRYNNRIRKVSEGMITTVAGTGEYGYNGDGTLATGASLRSPLGVAVDGAGNLFIADSQSNRVRRVDATTQIITTYAGNGSYGYSGDGGIATSAMLAGPINVSVRGGVLYVADVNNYRIRKVMDLDATPPVITRSLVGTLGANGWYRSDVSLTWSVVDAESATTNSTGCDPTSVTSDTSGITFTCSATSAGGTATDNVVIKRDATPPSATAQASPGPNGNGWNHGSVTVNITGADATSGIAMCDSVVLTAEGAALSASGTCTDAAGNASDPATASGINIDKTAPLVSATATPAPNGSGWNTTPVTVAFTGSDLLSGVAANGCDVPVVLSSDGAGQSATGTCTDRAGNTGSATRSDINIDQTAPTATASASPAANAHGWNSTNVTVSFSGADSLSGSGILSCSASQTLTAEGTGFSASGTCTDKAGLTSALASKTGINIDKTVPAISITTPPNGASYTAGAAVIANYSCTDGLSGLTTCAGPVANGAVINTGTVGSNSFTVSSTDLAGNSASQTNAYTVTPYTFIGFLPPVDNLPVTNTMNAGRVIPVKWQLKDSSGAYISSLASFVSLASQSITCDASPQDVVEEQLTSPGATVLTYDAASNQFQYNWKTTKGWTGCRLLQLTLADGSKYYAKVMLQ